MAVITREKIYSLLSDVRDPEIPVLSLVDLGVITGVEVQGEQVSIEMTPTFVGCPAIDYMQDDIREVLKANGITNVLITVSYKEPWTSDRISREGRDALRRFGLSPPPVGGLITDLEVLEHAECPRCNGTNTEMRNAFGPTLCRSIHFCKDCREAFEQFKPL